MNRERKQIISIESKFKDSINTVNDYASQNEIDFKMDPILLKDIMQGFPYLKQNKKLANYFLTFVYSNETMAIGFYLYLI